MKKIDTPDGWSHKKTTSHPNHNLVEYERGNGEVVEYEDRDSGKNQIRSIWGGKLKIASAVASGFQATEKEAVLQMKNYSKNLSLFTKKESVLESALSFTEKRALQKTISESLAALAAEGLTFTQKRALQKSVSDAFTRLNEKVVEVPAQDKEALAYELGKKAFADGKKRVPALDADFNEQVIKGSGNDTVKYLDAWLKAWDEANLAAPVEVADEPITAEDVAKELPFLGNFIGKSQLSAIKAAMKGEEKQHFFDMLIDLSKLIKKMPESYETDGQGDKAVAFLHYFKNASDWYITERDKGDPNDEVQGEQLQAFGYAILNGDKQNAEAGYISIKELIGLGVELDLYWTPKTLAEIKGKGGEEETLAYDQWKSRVIAEIQEREGEDLYEAEKVFSSQKKKAAGMWEAGIPPEEAAYTLYREYTPGGEQSSGTPTVAEVGQALEAKGWKRENGETWKIGPENEGWGAKGSYLVSGINKSEGNSGWITLDSWDGGAWVTVGRTIDLTGNTVESIIKAIEEKIAENEGSLRLKAMKDAVLSFEGDIKEAHSDFVSFLSGNDEKAVLAYDGGGYRVSFGVNGDERTDSYIKPEDAVAEYYAQRKGGGNEPDQQLADLLAGKFNGETPEAFLAICKSVIDRTGDVKAVIPACKAYLDANKDKVKAVMESAISETFEKMFGAMI